MDKIIKYKTLLLVLGFSLFLLFIPDQAHGWVLDLAKKQIGALTGIFGITISSLILAFLFYFIAYLYLYIVTFLLQGIIITTPSALIVTGDGRVAEIVRAGWNLSAGIVNLILIIAFIVIAFAVILGSEKIQLKKALPRLIMVALLVNFTLLFVGMGIDISNFLFNTIAERFMDEGVGSNIFLSSIAPLLAWGSDQARIFFAFVISKVFAMNIPYASSILQTGFTAATTVVYPLIFQLIFHGVIMWALAGIFSVT